MASLFYLCMKRHRVPTALASSYEKRILREAHSHVGFTLIIGVVNLCKASIASQENWLVGECAANQVDTASPNQTSRKMKTAIDGSEHLRSTATTTLHHWNWQGAERGECYLCWHVSDSVEMVSWHSFGSRSNRSCGCLRITARRI